MSKLNKHKTIIDNPLSQDEQKQLLVDAIQKRFPDTKFEEWPYIHLGHLLNYDAKGVPPYEFVMFFTNLLIFLAKHDLTDSFLKEVDEDGLDYIHKLIHFFSFIMDNDEHYAFIQYFMFKTVGCEAQQIVNAAYNYLTGPDKERVLGSNPNVF